jgi:hypothetical protein
MLPLPLSKLKGVDTVVNEGTITNSNREPINAWQLNIRASAIVKGQVDTE